MQIQQINDFLEVKTLQIQLIVVKTEQIILLLCHVNDDIFFLFIY